MSLYAIKALPHKVEDTGREHHFYDNKDASFEIMTPAGWHMGCCNRPAIIFCLSLGQLKICLRRMRIWSSTNWSWTRTWWLRSCQTGSYRPCLKQNKTDKPNSPADTSWTFAWGRPTRFDTWWMKSEIVGVTFPFSSNKHANTPIKSYILHRTSLASSPRQDPPERNWSNLAKMLVAVIMWVWTGQRGSPWAFLCPCRWKRDGWDVPAVVQLLANRRSCFLFGFALVEQPCLQLYRVTHCCATPSSLANNDSSNLNHET